MDTNPTQDLELATRVVAGDPTAQKVFIETYKGLIEGTLSKRARDPATFPAVEEVTLEILGDCLKRPLEGDDRSASGRSLLEKYLTPPITNRYATRGPLAAWLRLVAIRRFHDWLDKNGMSGRSIDISAGADDSEDSESDNGPEAEPFDPTEAGRDLDLMSLIREALKVGFEAAGRENPLGLVSLRLFWLYGIQKKRIAVAWRRHQANLTPKMEEAMAIIRYETLRHIRLNDPTLELSWDDLRAVCALHPELIGGV